MTAKKLLKILMVPTALLVSGGAFAGSGAVQYAFYPDPITDGRPCFFFYTNYDWTWYAIPYAYLNNGPTFAGATQQVMTSLTEANVNLIDANPTGQFCAGTPVAAVGLHTPRYP